MAPTTVKPEHLADLDSISNPLATSSQIRILLQHDNYHARSSRFAQAILTQAAGVLLRLPQDVIATAIVLLQRFDLSTGGRCGQTLREQSAACLYLSAKLSFTPLNPRSVINVYAYLLSSSSPLWFINPNNHHLSATGASVLEHNVPHNSPSHSLPQQDAQTYYVSPGLHERLLASLFASETAILSALGFDTTVHLPHPLALTYAQLLSSSHPDPSRPFPLLCRRIVAHLNASLFSPQFLYITHQPNALAVAAIYLAARETGFKLVERDWWTIFDVDREDLGFLVLAMSSLEKFAVQEMEKRYTGIAFD